MSAAGSCGPPRVATPPACRHSSTASHQRRKPRSRPSRSTCPPGIENAIRAPEGVPHAQVCFDPFHVVHLGGKACDQVRRDQYNQHGRSSTSEGRWIKGTRYSLLKDTAKQTTKQLLKLAEVVLTNKRMYRAFLLYGEL